MFPGRIVAVIGNSGSGKTTLVQALQRRGRFNLGLESHADRPFQTRLAAGLRRYTLPNQMDYLLQRAEQELDLRICPGVGLVDGGLDQDFWLFTRHFHKLGWLDADEYQLCRRFYDLARALLPPPDLIVLLKAPVSLAGRRLEQRRRAVEVAKAPDLAALDVLLSDWTSRLSPSVTLKLKAADPVETLADQVCRALAGRDWGETC
jgi:deoxyadenosine/deoxycytidine kinase